MIDDAAKFWNDFETSTGEKVEAKTIGTYYEPGGDDHGLWGLLILTDASFRFRHFPSQSWILGLIRSNRVSAAAVREVEIVVPRRDIAALSIPKLGFLARLFGPAFPRFELTWREGGADWTESFAASPSSDVLRLLGETAGAAFHLY